jgi:predicted DNA-binding transcriptional regulator AlpA
MNQLLTADEVAHLLRISKRQVYELCKERTRVTGDLRDNPLPCVRIGSSVRFQLDDVNTWVETLATKKG